MNARRTTWYPLCTALALGIVALSGGCRGHGKYTSELKGDAEDRMARLKAGTEWDMAQQQFLSGDLNKALKSVDLSIAIADDVTKSHVLRGRILMEMGRLDAAIESFDRAIALDEKFTEAHYYKGLVFERFTQLEKAYTSYGKAASLDPSNPQYTIAAAEMLIDMGRLDEARAMLSKGEGAFQHNAGVRQTLGHIAMMEGRIDDAVTLFNEACLLAPDEDNLVEDLARAQIAARKFADAEYSIRRLLAHDKEGERRDLRFLQARCLVEIDKPVEARSILQQIVNDPRGAKDIQAWTELGNIAVTLKDERRLRECASRLIAIAPDEHEGYFLLAAWQRSRGNLKGAIASLDKAIERAGNDAAPAVMQGLLYQEIGMQAQAERAFRAALRANPNDERARALLGKVEGRSTTLTGASEQE